MALYDVQEDKQTPPWMQAAFAEALPRARKILEEKKRERRFTNYQERPREFLYDVFGETYYEDTLEIADSVLDNIVTIARSANGVGKSFMAARIALWFFSVFPQSKIFITAAPPLDNLRNILWGELMTAIKKKPELVYGCKVKSGNQLLIAKSPNNFIAGIAIPTAGTAEDRESKFSGKHASHMLFIVDEGDAVPDEIYKGIDSCMSGGEMVRLLVMFNPRAKAGPVHYKESHGLANIVQLSALKHPNVLFGRDIIPGAVTRTTTLRRYHMWTRPIGHDERITGEAVQVPDILADQPVEGLDGKIYPALQAGDWRVITEPSFSYMVLGEYPSQGVQQLISQEWISDARARWDLYVSKFGEVPPVGTKPIMGIDIAEYGVDASVACFRYGGFVTKLVTWDGVDPDKGADRAVTLYRERGVDLAMVDATGVGAGVAPAIVRRGRKDKMRAYSVKVGSKPSPLIKSEIGDFMILRDQLWWMMREWLRTNDTAMLPPDNALLEELRVATYEVSNRGKINIMPKKLMRDRLHRSPDRADALALTFTPFEKARWLQLEGID